MRVSGTLRDALYRWATIERTGLDLGYPKECPTTRGYQPYAHPREHQPAPGVSDLEILELICKVVNRLGSENRKCYDSLVYHYGAYPNAPETQGMRDKIGKAHIGEKAYWRHLDISHNRLQGVVDAYC